MKTPSLPLALNNPVAEAFGDVYNELHGFGVATRSGRRADVERVDFQLFFNAETDSRSAAFQSMNPIHILHVFA